MARRIELVGVLFAGLPLLREVSERGEFLRTHARVLWAVALFREKRLEEAVRVLEKLRPESPFFLPGQQGNPQNRQGGMRESPSKNRFRAVLLLV